MQLGEVDRHPIAEIGQGVSISPLRLPDQAFAPEFSQGIADRGRRDLPRGGSQPVPQDGPQILVGERAKRKPGAPDGLQESHRPLRAEPETGDALPSFKGGTCDSLKRRAIQGGGRNHRERFQEARDGMVSDASEIPQMRQALIDAEVAGDRVPRLGG